MKSIILIVRIKSRRLVCVTSPIVNTSTTLDITTKIEDSDASAVVSGPNVSGDCNSTMIVRT